MIDMLKVAHENNKLRFKYYGKNRLEYFSTIYQKRKMKHKKKIDVYHIKVWTISDNIDKYVA